jgi:CheY-like chemotaxis protein
MMNKLHVLIVEDNEFWQDILLEEFENYGCDVDVASTYSEARIKLVENAYDMVTLDITLSSTEEKETLGVRGGWRLLVHKLAPDFPDTAIFIISGSLDDTTRAFDLSKKYGVKGYMPKDNFDSTVLKQWVDEVREFKQTDLQGTFLKNNQGIPLHLSTRLREILLRCGPFDSAHTLRIVFVDVRIQPWRNHLPEAGTIDERVKATIDFLHNQYSAEKQNALILLLQILSEQASPGTACRKELADLVDILQVSLQYPI